MARVPIVFGDARRLTGFYHPPDGSRVRSQAVVLCNPLGYEAMSVHRTYRHLAERLASSGFPVLRFDYHGTGDSPAPSNHSGGPAAWVESIRSAAGEARRLSGAERLALVGTGFGASLAATAAARMADVESLVLWAPVVSGRAYARALRAFRLFKYSDAGPAPRNDGGEEIAGYFFSRETLAAFAEIDLLRLASLPRRALVLGGGDDPEAEAQLVEDWKSKGCDARGAAVAGYAQMMRDDPYESVVPVAALEEIFAWLGEGDRLDRVPPAPAPFEPTSLEIQPETGAQTARETACLFGPQERLFGILTEPASGARPGDPAVILLNVGSNTHVGPHRMNVELAREMASLGFTALRMDASGLGESPAAAGTSENRIYTLDAVGDVQAAMSAISRATGAERFVLVGLCSGAYLAFHTAVADPRVIGQVLLSPYAFEWKEGDPVAPQERKGAQAYRSTRFYLKAVLDPRAWWLVLQGKVNVTGIASAILERAFERIEGALPGLSALIRRQQPPQSPIERSFRALCDRGVQTLMVLAFDDGGLDMVARYLGKDARRLRGQSRFALQILGSVDHTFTTLASQQLLHQTLTRYLSEHFS